jgi:hypothetical protein
MGKDQSEVGATLKEDSQRDPAEIRRDIEETRAELGDTVEALAAKTDVKTRAKEKVAVAKSNAPSTAREHPVPVAAVGGFAAGFVVAKLLGRR